MYQRLAELVQSGRDEEAHEYLTNHLPLLPKELQDEIVMKLFVQGAIDEAEELTTIDELQEEAVETGEALLKAQKDLDDTSAQAPTEAKNV